MLSIVSLGIVAIGGWKGQKAFQLFASCPKNLLLLRLNLAPTNQPTLAPPAVPGSDGTG
jgi:hypothetical protein